MHKLERVEVHTYRFSGFSIIAKKYQSRLKPTWIMVCQDCGQQLPIKQLGSVYWVAKCNDCKIEYTITEKSVYKEIETDLERIM